MKTNIIIYNKYIIIILDKIMTSVKMNYTETKRLFKKYNVSVGKYEMKRFVACTDILPNPNLKDKIGITFLLDENYYYFKLNKKGDLKRILKKLHVIVIKKNKVLLSGHVLSYLEPHKVIIYDPIAEYDLKVTSRYKEDICNLYVTINKSLHRRINYIISIISYIESLTDEDTMIFDNTSGRYILNNYILRILLLAKRNNFIATSLIQYL